MKLEIFEKSTNIKFHENPSSGGRVVACGQTDGQMDRHDKAISRFSSFCEQRLKTLQLFTTDMVRVHSNSLMQ
jgi:hypothetical protein